jgi:hypothetical protein
VPQVVDQLLSFSPTREKYCILVKGILKSLLVVAEKISIPEKE